MVFGESVPSSDFIGGLTNIKEDQYEILLEYAMGE